MKEYKFRGKRFSTGEEICGYYVGFNEFTNVAYLLCEDEIKYEVDPSSVEQVFEEDKSLEEILCTVASELPKKYNPLHYGAVERNELFAKAFIQAIRAGYRATKEVTDE